MAAACFEALLEFSVREARQAEFEYCYGPAGIWARLFSQAPGFIGTKLLRDCASETLTAHEAPLGEYTPAGAATR